MCTSTSGEMGIPLPMFVNFIMIQWKRLLLSSCDVDIS